ncbi:MAG TPA: C25 family cysteine peptidase, partial [Phnomibacter sp.]|nr:C25 family cysteine peptidase [Phnomibacter sp.]
MQLRSLTISMFALFVSLGSKAQFNNEWIDYSKPYYKFYIAQAGIYRINKSTLDAAGIGATPAEHFQLWRNGKQLPLYTSILQGPLTSSDYIEFFGDKNDGVIDKALYRNPNDHITDQTSLFTDTAAYFLTVNPNTASNLRYSTITNDAGSSALTPLPNVWKLVRHDYKNIVNGVHRNYVNRGTAVDFGELVYSSSYELGEMMSSGDIFPSTANQAAVFSNLLPYTAGSSQAKVRVSIAGSANNNRTVRIDLNGAPIFDRNYNRFQARIDSANIAVGLLNNANTVIGVTNLSANPNDRVVAGFAEIDYARLPDAANSSLFDFYLPPAAQPSLVEIANFNHGNQPPTLYDVGTGLRMQGQLAPDGKVRFLLPASSTTRKCWLVSNAASRNINALVQKTFTAFTSGSNQANYIIITNRVLTQGNNNAVEQYRQYRSSATGGGFTTRIYFIDELVDQFAFGIKMHPLSIKNFLRFARARFSPAPQYCLLIGKGVTYDEYRFYENHPLANTLNLVPTFGYPASDVLLSSEDLTAAQTTIGIGRINAVNASEVSTYLEKIKEFEAAQANPS